MRFLLFIPLLALLGCASSPEQTTAHIEVFNETQLHYHGSIAPENTRAVASLLTANPEIDTLIISSNGGEVRSGMELGELVHERQLKVRVRGVCLSSCANYVVTASPAVLVEEGALLGWHGGALQSYYASFGGESLSPRRQKVMQAFLTQWQQQEAEFFALTGVDQAVTILGMTPELIKSRDAATFSYDIDTLHRLGLNIEFEDPEPTQHQSDGDKLVQIFTLSEQALSELLAQHRQTTADSGNNKEQ
ncbi:hypothetical protein ACR0ST_03510 [Aliidiomarina sp. Khilg15.8]